MFKKIVFSAALLSLSLFLYFRSDEAQTLRSPASQKWLVSRETHSFLEKNGEDFEQDRYQPSVNSLGECPVDFRQIEDEFKVQGNVDEVFKAFAESSPKSAWNGLARFDLMVLPRDVNEPEVKGFDRSEEKFPKIAVGQLYFLNLKIALGMHIPVAFRIVDLNPEKKHAAFSYVRANKSHGIQDIQFLAEQPGWVKIIHKTCYKSESGLRDRIYPPIHSRLVGNYYQHLFQRLADIAR